MRNWLEKMAYKHSVFMQGRNGYDEYSRFLSFAALGCWIVSFIFSMFSSLVTALGYVGNFFYFVGLFAFIMSIIRAYSKNLGKRQQENENFLRLSAKFKGFFKTRKNMWSERKTHTYIKCPSCKVYIRIRKPERGKTIELRCPKCGNTFKRRT